MITGFNTDIKFEGITYHVQTEDKGVDSPLILSLVYVGGAILASKRTPYEDLVTSGFDEKVLTERLQRQHKLICAAIRSGRIEELKRMGTQNGSADAQHGDKKEHAPTEEIDAAGRKKKESDSVPIIESDSPVENDCADTSSSESEVQIVNESEVKIVDDVVILTTLMDQVSEVWDRSNTYAPTFQPPPRISPLIHEELPVVEILDVHAQPWQEELSESPQDTSNELYLSLLDDEGDFRAGQLATIKIHVGRGPYGQKPVTDATVTVKVLGTTFRPMIQMAETDERGVAVVRAMLPRFTSGRAAIIIRAAEGDDAIEMRRIIHQ